jgi:hypothetical protein
MKNWLLLTAVLLLSTLYLKAQTADPELDYIKKAYSKDKKAIVDEYMGLDVQKGGKFWPIYAEYESKREKLAQSRLKTIQEYVDHAENMSEATADKIAVAALNNSASLSKLNLDYYKKMKLAVGAVQAAKFIQLETYLQSVWRTYVQDNIPMIGQLDQTQKNN